MRLTRIRNIARALTQFRQCSNAGSANSNNIKWFCCGTESVCLCEFIFAAT